MIDSELFDCRLGDSLDCFCFWVASVLLFWYFVLWCLLVTLFVWNTMARIFVAGFLLFVACWGCAVCPCVVVCGWLFAHGVCLVVWFLWVLGFLWAYCAFGVLYFVSLLHCFLWLTFVWFVGLLFCAYVYPLFCCLFDAYAVFWVWFYLGCCTLWACYCFTVILSCLNTVVFAFLDLLFSCLWLVCLFCIYCYLVLSFAFALLVDLLGCVVDYLLCVDFGFHLLSFAYCLIFLD